MAQTRKFCDIKEISPETLEIVKSLGFERTTPVQEATIPLFAGNKDVAVDACTGSGKTLAFIIPLIEKMRRLEEPLKRHQVGAVVVSPTRELARQIHAVLEPFAASVPGLTTMLLTGGSDPLADVAAFQARGGHVLVGTPGRLSDVFERSSVLDPKRLEVLVLDEADRLLDAGYGKHLEALMRRLPKQRRTGLFSATQTEAVQALARAGLRNQVRVNVAVGPAPSTSGREHGPAPGGGGARRGNASAGAQQQPDQRTPAGLAASYLICESDQKLAQLLHFLQDHQGEKAIVYFLTCAAVDFYALALPLVMEGAAPAVKESSSAGKKPQKQQGKAGWQVAALHGRMKQSQREATLAAFAAAPSGVLLATDVAARGLDIPDVAWIVQFDPPQDPDVFVHRVGRTARAGRSGAALAFLLPKEAPYVEFLRIRKVPMAEQAAAQGLPDPLPRLRRAAERDREVMEKGTRGFVSYVRGYREHQCRFIFRTADMDLGRLATAFALLRLPRMPELPAGNASGLAHFTPSPVDPGTVKFKDKAREKQRQRLLTQRALERAEEAAAQLQSGHAGAHAGPARGKKEEKPVQERRLPAAKRRALGATQDEEDFADDYRALKKVKKGRISEDDFEAALGLTAAREEDAGVPAGGAGKKPKKKQAFGGRKPKKGLRQ